jgi:polyhydroxyalkanoate synthesis repressor PhaR
VGCSSEWVTSVKCLRQTAQMWPYPKERSRSNCRPRESFNDGAGKPSRYQKYGNRRLCNTVTSTNGNVESLASVAKRGDDFVVYDAKSGDDITRFILRCAHRVMAPAYSFRRRKKSGQYLLPVAFMRRLIGFNGEAMQEMVPAYLERSMEALTRERKKQTEVRQHVAESSNPPRGW